VGTYDSVSYPPNYSIGNRFASYPVNDSDIFSDWVDILSNDNVTDGYYVELIVTHGSADVNSSTHNGTYDNINLIISKLCTSMTFNVYETNRNGSRVNLIPYLAAPAHLTISYQDGALYHGHGMYIPQGMSFPQIVSDMQGMGMNDLMKLNPQTDMMYNLSMNGMMIGILPNSSINCNTDEGVVMMDMGNMMDMSIYYGPPTFNTVASIFNFNDGAGRWEVFAYLKFKLPSGESRLIVPHFQVQVYDVYDTPSTLTSTGEEPEPVDDSTTTAASGCYSSFVFSFFTLFVVFVLSF